jgi:hypothetical protein
MISPFQRSFSFGWRLLCTGFLLSTAAHAQSAPAAPPAKADFSKRRWNWRSHEPRYNSFAPLLRKPSNAWRK